MPRLPPIGTRKGDAVSVRRVEGKREYPDPPACEMCCKEGRRLVYHHWDDDDYSLGLWLCQHCHNAAHVVESGRDELYKSAKVGIERRGLTVVSGTTK